MLSNIFRKSFGEYILIIIIAILILSTYYILMEYFSQMQKAQQIQQIQQTESMACVNYSKPTWGRNTCGYLMSDTIQDELTNGGFVKSDNDWSVYFPCAYDEIAKEVNQMPVVNGGKYFILENCDIIVAKELLWKYVVEYHGIEKAQTLLPNSYILYEDDDVNRFKNEFDILPNKMYIMKKNIQRQEGLKISNDKNTIVNGFKDPTDGGYVLAQELLQDPYTISGRKTNMRFYVLVVCKGDDMTVFVYNDGFMYYTREPFEKGTMDSDRNITTGYIDRQVYVDNPLTHGDLRTYLDDPNRNNLNYSETQFKNQGFRLSEIYFNRIYGLIRDVFLAFVGKLSGPKANRKFNDTNVMFQIFGVDVAVNDKLSPMIMEVNKGPDLGAKDDRDSELKHGVVKDTFKVVGLVGCEDFTKTNFIKVLDVSNGSIN